MHNRIFDKCNELGCTISKYITSTLEESLDRQVDEKPDEEIKEEPKITVEDIPKPVMSEIKSIDGIPIEKFQSGEYYIQDSKVVKRQELGIIEKIIDEITN